MSVDDATEIRISEIMEELSCDHDTAEMMFRDEILDKYETDDIDVAEAMFRDDVEDANAQLSM